QCVTPRCELCFAFPQQRPNQALEGLRQRRVRNVALVLIELAGSKQASRRYQYWLKLVHHGRLADARIAGHQYQFRRTPICHAAEGSEQSFHVAATTVELLGNQQTVGRIALAEWKIGNSPMRLPLSSAVVKVTLEAGGRLIAFFGSFGEQLHD